MQGIHLTLLSRQCVLLEPGASLNPAKPEQYADEIISFLQKNRSLGLIYDLKDISLIDKTYFNWLNYLHTLCRLNNTIMVTVNMSPSAAYGLSLFMDEFPDFKTALSVEDARKHIVMKKDG